MRPSIYDTFAMVAIAMAERSTCSARVRVGAVLFDKDHRVIATGYNGAPRGFKHCDDIGCDLDSDGHCKNSIHAEENALLQCAVIGRSTEGLSIFTTHIPCWKCALRLVQAGITDVIYMEPYGSDVLKTTTMFLSHNVRCSSYTGDYKV